MSQTRTPLQVDELIEAALAGVDRAVLARRAGEESQRPFPIWFGFVFDGGPMPWPTEPRPGEPEPIGDVIFRAADDHTRIVEAVFERAIPLLKTLGVTEDPSKRPSPDDVMQGLLDVPLPDRTRQSVERVIDVQKRYGSSLQRRSGGDERLDQLRERLREAHSVDNKIDALARLRSETTDEAMGIALDLATEMLRQGRGTIYNPGYYDRYMPARSSAKAKDDAADEITDADIEGAVAGAIGGAFAGGGPLTAIGAGAGAGAFASAGKAVTKLIDWIF